MPAEDSFTSRKFSDLGHLVKNLQIALSHGNKATAKTLNLKIESLVYELFNMNPNDIRHIQEFVRNLKSHSKMDNYLYINAA